MVAAKRHGAEDGKSVAGLRFGGILRQGDGVGLDYGVEGLPRVAATSAMDSIPSLI